LSLNQYLDLQAGQIFGLSTLGSHSFPHLLHLNLGSKFNISIDL